MSYMTKLLGADWYLFIIKSNNFSVWADQFARYVWLKIFIQEHGTKFNGILDNKQSISYEADC